MYSVRFKVWIEKGGKFVAGEGRAALLRAIKKHGSLRLAAEELGISYRHAWGMLREMSPAAGSPVAKGASGGRGHGRTLLTTRGEQILQAYDSAVRRLERGRGPWLTVDGIVLDERGLLLVKRRRPPFEGCYALPGGVVEEGERVEEAVVREVLEETGLKTRVAKLFGVYSDPKRDPRGHTVSVVFRLDVVGGRLRGGDDASEAAFFPLRRLPPLGFDHEHVVRDFLRSRRLRSCEGRMSKR